MRGCKIKLRRGRGNSQWLDLSFLTDRDGAENPRRLFTVHFVSTVAPVPVSHTGTGSGTAAAAVTRLMVVAAVRHAVMDVLSGGRAALHRTQGQALPVAEPAGMIAAAVGHAVMDVPAGHLAALHGTKRETLAVAHAAGVAIAAVGHAVVGVPSGGLTALHGTNSDLRRLWLGVPAAAAVVSADVAVGHSRNHQGQRRQAGQEQNRRPFPGRLAGCG